MSEPSRFVVTITQRLGLGKLAYKVWYAPRAFARRCAQEGPLQVAQTAYGHRMMMRAAHSLEPLESPAVDREDKVRDVYFLTGHRYWHQTLFCGRSLLRVAGVPIRFIVVDDGSLRHEERRRLAEGLGRVEVRSISEDMLDQSLPRKRFPTLRSRRETYAHLRKLTDIHAGQTGWKLVCDSDMLFLRRPEAMLDWLTQPRGPCHLVDVEDAYGYSPALLTTLIADELPRRVNVGLCGLKSDNIDWERLEYWCGRLIEKEGMKYLLEQALSAMLMSGSNHLPFDESEYIVAPSRAQTRMSVGTMHHYTASSKSWYYRFGWKIIA